MIDHFLRDASGFFSCPFWSTVLQCGARLPIHTLNYWTVQSVVPGSYLGVCFSVTLLIVDLLQFCVLCRRSSVTRCTRLMIRLPRPYVPVRLHAVPWSHIGILMRHLAAEARGTTGLLFRSQCPSGTILLIPYSMVYDWLVSRAGKMPFYWPKLLYPYYSLLLFFPFSSSCL